MKTFFKTLAFCMIVVLFLSCVTSLFDFGSDDEPTGPGNIVQKPPTDTQEPEEPEEPEKPSCTHVDADDNELCDLCGESFSDGIECSHADVDDDELCDNCNKTFEDGCDVHIDANDDELCDLCGESFSDGQDLFGGTVLASKTFDGETVTFENGVGKPNMGSFNPNAKYGIFTTEDGYAKVYTTEAHAGIESDSFFAIYANEEREAIDLSCFDYLTIDFDLWTDSEYISPIHFIFLENWQTNLTSTNHFTITKQSDDCYYLDINSGYRIQRIISTSEVLHFTFVVKTNTKSSGTSAGISPNVLIYLNGEFITEEACEITNFTQFEQLRMLFIKQTVEAGKSVCVDNIQVSKFGTSTNNYHGALSDAYNDHSINLTECADSVLYNKNN